MRWIILPAALLAVVLLLPTAQGAPDGWHRSIEDGITAAKKSGRPVLVVTAWKEKV